MYIHMEGTVSQTFEKGLSFYFYLETFMGLDQRTGAGTNPRIPRVVSKSDRDHRTATTDNRNLGLTPAVTISRSNLSLSLYPIRPV